MDFDCQCGCKFSPVSYIGSPEEAVDQANQKWTDAFNELTADLDRRMLNLENFKAKHQSAFSSTETYIRTVGKLEGLRLAKELLAAAFEKLGE